MATTTAAPRRPADRGHRATSAAAGTIGRLRLLTAGQVELNGDGKRSSGTCAGMRTARGLGYVFGIGG
jgi:hypothetical protein